MLIMDPKGDHRAAGRGHHRAHLRPAGQVDRRPPARGGELSRLHRGRFGDRADHRTELIKDNLAELLPYAETQKLLDELSKDYLSLIDAGAESHQAGSSASSPGAARRACVDPRFAPDHGSHQRDLRARPRHRGCHRAHARASPSRSAAPTPPSRLHPDRQPVPGPGTSVRRALVGEPAFRPYRLLAPPQPDGPRGRSLTV
jgi:hypothetical protein